MADDVQAQFEEIMDALRAQAERENAHYTDVMLLLKKIEEKLESLDEDNSTITYFDDDEMFEEAKKLVAEARKASTSFLQRSLGIGYAKAARLIDKLEEEGVIGEGDGAKPREVLIESFEDEVEKEKSWLEGDDEKYEDVKTAVLEAGKVSISFLQRKFDVGFARAARLIDMLQANGVVEKGDYKKVLKVIQKKEEE